MSARRLDVWLVQEGHFPSRQRAQGAILAGLIRVDGAKVDKAGFRVGPEARVEVKGDPVPFVSRGGLKLDHALNEFALEVAGRIALDAGASTGGFTDCLLSRGASLVYAVDVGYGQLAWKLRNHPRVRVMERTNLRYLQPADLDPRPDLVTLDLSFISLTLVLPAVARFMVGPGDVVCLVKPQFEAGRELVGRGGVVRDPAVHLQVLRRTVRAAEDDGFAFWGVTASPILGAEGNREFLLWLRRGAEGQDPAPSVSPLRGELRERALVAAVG